MINARLELIFLSTSHSGGGGGGGVLNVESGTFSSVCETRCTRQLRDGLPAQGRARSQPRKVTARSVDHVACRVSNCRYLRRPRVRRQRRRVYQHARINYRRQSATDTHRRATAAAYTSTYNCHVCLGAVEPHVGLAARTPPYEVYTNRLNPGNNRSRPIRIAHGRICIFEGRTGFRFIDPHHTHIIVELYAEMLSKVLKTFAIFV